jgi:hypothetical protein
VSRPTERPLHGVAPGRGGREREERGAPLSTLKAPRVLVGGDDTHPGRYVDPHTPEGQAEQEKYRGPGARRFSGEVVVCISNEPIAGQYIVTLSTPFAGESVRVPASEVALVEKAAERYDQLAAMALARSEHMRGHAAWCGGPSTRRTWTDYVIGRSPRRRRQPGAEALGQARSEAMSEAPPFTFAIIAHTPRSRRVWSGIASREAAEERRAKEMRRYKVCEIVPEALADILGRMHDDDPDVAWDADLLDTIDQILRRDGFVHGGHVMAWLTRHAPAWPPAAALRDIVNVIHPLGDPDVAWGADTFQAIDQILVRYGFVPRPKQRARTRR